MERRDNPDIMVRLKNGRINNIIIDENNNSLVSVELNAVKDINGRNAAYNLIPTVFNAKPNYLINLLGNTDNRVIYEKEAETNSQVNPRLNELSGIVNESPQASDTIISKSSEKSNGVLWEDLSAADDTDTSSATLASPLVGKFDRYAGSSFQSRPAVFWAANTIGAGQGNRRTAIVPRRTIPKSPFVQYLEDIKDGIPNNIGPRSTEKNSGENVFAEQGNTE